MFSLVQLTEDFPTRTASTDLLRYDVVPRLYVRFGPSLLEEEKETLRVWGPLDKL